MWARRAAEQEQVVHRIVNQVREIYEGFGTPWITWKSAHLDAQEKGVTGSVTTSPDDTSARGPFEGDELIPNDPVERAVVLCRNVADDQRQRCLEFRAGSVWDLSALRDIVNKATLTEAGNGAAPLAHVQAWVWKSTTDGHPMTNSGTDTGFELRLSYNKRARPIEQASR